MGKQGLSDRKDKQAEPRWLCLLVQERSCSARGKRQSQTEKTSKQTMNDLLACLWELWHNNGMNITNLPPMGNAERGITYPFSMGTYFGTSLFFRHCSDAGGRWRSVSDRKDKQAPRIIEEVLSARKENSGRLLVRNFLNNMGDLS